eukprot:TRINITY_DN26981_c0_g1_i1.p1 TRINITY_DN26981_c0_g1~~TRINITY_DN26981_c0_g1_i1.p1  ORF type:complete len:1101 (+),score=323.63 TRINITY_DN26981_c0_g1_i1:109-3411(+)
MADRVNMVAAELLSTEESFVHSLEIFIEVIAPVLKQDKVTGVDASILALVSNAEQVYTLNKKFLSDLDKMIRAASSDPGGSIAPNDLDSRKLHFGKLFKDYAPLFRIYAQYAKNHETGTNSIRKLRGTNARLNKTIQDAEHLPVCRGQSLWSFLIMPVQRVPRYVLLLREILKRLPDDHPDKQNVTIAIESVGEVGDYLNEAIKKRENMEKISELELRFNGAVELLVPGRILIKEGLLKKLSHRGHLTEYVFHLFNDLLIYSKQSMQGLLLKQRIDLLNLSVENFDRNDMIKEPVELGSAFKITSPAVSFVVVGKNQKECDEWMDLLKETVENLDKSGNMRRESQNFVSQFFGKIKMGNNNAALIATDLSMSGAAPVWVPDTENANCTICGSEFSLFNRKHHCRNCGQIVCNSCSPFKRILENIGDEPVRICKNCDDDLKKAYKSKTGKPFFLVKGKPMPKQKVETEDEDDEEEKKVTEPEEMNLDGEVDGKSTISSSGGAVFSSGGSVEGVPKTISMRKKKHQGPAALSDIQWGPSGTEEDENESLPTMKTRTLKSGKVKFSALEAKKMVAENEETVSKARLDEAQLILNAEKAYVDNLNVLLDVFVNPLINQHPALKKKTSSFSGLTIVFDCIEQILTVHSKFLADLDERIKQWKSNPVLGDIFASLAPLFRIYGNYAANFEEALTTLRSPTFLNSIKKYSEDSRCKGRRLNDFLNMPMQRVIFYARDWKNLMKVTPQDHPDYADLENAMNSLSEAAVHIQESIRLRENRARILQIEEMFIGKVELITPMRKFIREGLLFVSDKSGEFEKRQCHLFDDVLLCSEITNIGYSLKRLYYVNNMISVENVPSTGTEHNFVFAVRGVDSSFLASVSNATLRDGWVRDLSTVIMDCAKERTMDATYTIDQAAPLWSPDHVSDSCTLCLSPFSFWNRKHHCRKCGRLVCNACSMFRVFLPSASDNTAVRICKQCKAENPHLKEAVSPTASNPEDTVRRKSSVIKGVNQAVASDGPSSPISTIDESKTGSVENKVYQEEDLRPSDAFLNRTFGDRPFEKHVTEDGKVYYYDAEKDQSAWDLKELVEQEIEIDDEEEDTAAAAQTK